MASSIFIPADSQSTTGSGAIVLATNPSLASPTITGQGLFADGTAGAPSISFTNDANSGFYSVADNAMDFASNGIARMRWSTTGISLLRDDFSTIAMGSAVDTIIARGAAGRLNVTNTAGAIGSSIKVDALPTVASGFFSAGTAPAITAGSTPFAGSVNVGTGTPAASGVINFNGTAFPSAPFAIAINNSTAALLKCVATTTQLTITGAANFTASDVISWVCISSK